MPERIIPLRTSSTNALCIVEVIEAVRLVECRNLASIIPFPPSILPPHPTPFLPWPQLQLYLAIHGPLQWRAIYNARQSHAPTPR